MSDTDTWENEGGSCQDPEEVRCPMCNIIVPEARAELGYKTCIKHSDEKVKDHQPGVVNSLGLHEKYFPEGR